MARPKLELDADMIEKLASIQCTIQEIAAVMGCDRDTISDNYSAQIAKGRERGKMSLRRKQWDVAMKGNPTLLIWLGKNYLDQKDKLATEENVTTEQTVTMFRARYRTPKKNDDGDDNEAA